MNYTITARTAHGAVTYKAVGDWAALVDAAYQAGALGVSAIRTGS